MAIPTLSVTPNAVAGAYRATQAGTPAVGGGGFGEALTRAMQGAVDASRTAEQQSKLAIAGQGNLTEVATAVAKAELALQTTVTLRDKIVQAYQSIMSMPI